MPPDLTAVLRDAVVPVLAQLVRAEEIDRVSLQRNESAAWVELTLRGEQAHLWVWTAGETPLGAAGLRQRMASDLQDFIAESGFGWGELRPDDVH